MAAGDDEERELLAGVGLQPAGHASDGVPTAPEPESPAARDGADGPREADRDADGADTRDSRRDDGSPERPRAEASSRPRSGGGPPAAAPALDDAEGRADKGRPRKTIAGLVVGIVGVIFFGFGFLLGPIAFGLSYFGRKETANGRPGRNLATAGLVLGVVSFVAFFVALALR